MDIPALLPTSHCEKEMITFTNKKIIMCWQRLSDFHRIKGFRDHYQAHKVNHIGNDVVFLWLLCIRRTWCNLFHRKNHLYVPMAFLLLLHSFRVNDCIYVRAIPDNHSPIQYHSIYSKNFVLKLSSR